MRGLFTIVVCLFVGLATSGQEPFEGIIEYRMTSPDSTVDVRINAIFGQQKIRFTTKIISGIPILGLKEEDVLINFQNSVIEREIHSDSTVEFEEMRGNSDIPFLVEDPSSRRKILGHDCILYNAGEINRKEVKDGDTVEVKANLKIWYSTDLHYPVPDELKMIQMVPLFTNGKVALGSGAEVKLGPAVLHLSTTATWIEAGSTNPRDFEHPPGYKFKAVN